MFIVMSADKADQHYVLNLRNTLELVDIVESLRFEYQLGTGTYGGKAENCIKIEVSAGREWEAFQMASDLMDAYKQECIMYVDNSGNGTLLYANGNSERLGVWHEVQKGFAGTIDHTEINGRYYACF